ncbi:hypothetical protein MDS_2201 [Ectopseudomonas mendocina NK-01]|nr:hypothetical protein MDS_2201 [Pseudomonas mendocina NK-01]
MHRQKPARTGPEFKAKHSRGSILRSHPRSRRECGRICKMVRTERLELTTTPANALQALIHVNGCACVSVDLFPACSQ